MHAASLWTIAAFLATLVLVARAFDADLTDCCKTPEKVLSKFDGQIKCGLKNVLPNITSIYNCVIECVYTESGFLNDDNTINEQKFREKIIEASEKSGEDVKPIIQAGLDTCFSEIHKKASQIQEVNRVNLSGKGCKIEPKLVWTCLGGYVLYNCPASDWKEDEPKCAGKRDQFINSHKGRVHETDLAQENAESKQQQ